MAVDLPARLAIDRMDEVEMASMVEVGAVGLAIGVTPRAAPAAVLDLEEPAEAGPPRDPPAADESCI